MGTGFFNGNGSTYTQIDPAEVERFRDEAKASADAAEASKVSSQNAAADATASAILALQSEHNAAASEANAASSASAAAGSATSASDSALTATAQAGIATTKAGEASDSATIASTQAGTATSKAGEASSSASAAAGSANSASTSASTATTQAGVASSKAGEAASSAASALGSASTATEQADIATLKAALAVSSASDAYGSATTATAQAGIAAAKAGEAATSASASAGSASSASSSAASALDSLKAFRDVYYGPLPSDPTTDPDGNPCNSGDLYFSSTAGQLRVFDGAAWQIYNPLSGTSTYVRFDAPGGYNASQRLQARSNIASSGSPHCGRLAHVSSTALQFSPYNGADIRINGVIYQIPSTGIAGLSNTGVYVNGVSGQSLSANTLYYVYAWLNGSTIYADYSTAGYVMSDQAGNVGTFVKTGDNSRTLIGMVYTNVSGQFSGYMTVASFFNRRSKAVLFGIDNSSTTSTDYVRLGSQSVDVVNWGDEAVITSSLSQCAIAGSTYGIIRVSADSPAISTGALTIVYQTAFSPYPAGCPSIMSEGKHNWMLSGAVSAAGGTLTAYNQALSIVTMS